MSVRPSTSAAFSVLLTLFFSCSTPATEKTKSVATPALSQTVYITEQNNTPTVDLPGYTLVEMDVDRKADATAILNVKRNWPLVMQAPSRAGFDSLLAPNFTFTDNGKIFNRADYIQNRLEPSDWKITHVIYRNVTLQFIDQNTALLTYRNEVTNTLSSTGEVEIEFITWADTYTRVNNTWKISAAHVIDFRIEKKK